MKDRTPKFPGRVKLKPVAGQTDTYDMTRADDPDDTGTPFNTRTMLQNSTGRFLRLPYANPLVDDAFRHMVDRIVPIGTIRTSPAQSLGDAWLKCDGSQVTFTEYPQLCQLLRNTVGDVSWQSSAVGTSPSFTGMSRSVYFKGKWYVAGTYTAVISRVLKKELIIGASDVITGPYETVYTKTYSKEVTGNDKAASAIDVQLAANGDRICALYYWTTEYTISSTEDGTTWADNAVNFQLPTGKENGAVSMKGFATDGTYWVFASGRQIIYTTDPTSDKAWNVNELLLYPYFFTGRLSFSNGTWLICSHNAYRGSNPINESVKIHYTKTPGGNWTSVNVGAGSKLYQYASAITWFSDRYWFVYRERTQTIAKSKTYLASAYESNMNEWSTQEIGDIDIEYVDGAISGYTMPYDFAATSNLLVLICNQNEIKTTSDPELGWNDVTLPSGAAPTDLATDGETIVASCSGMIVYHDYSEETRLLPVISLSNDTTTFIKAKNELDVFESQQSGG